MIKLLVINHKFHYEMEKLVRIFMPDVKIQVVYEDCDDFNISTSVTDEIKVIINFDTFNKTLTAHLHFVIVAKRSSKRFIKGVKIYYDLNFVCYRC